MNTRRLAGWIVIGSALLLSMSVGFYDWRAGGITLGGLGLIVGVWALLERE